MAKITTVNELGLHSLTVEVSGFITMATDWLCVYLDLMFLSCSSGNSHGKCAASRIIPNKSWLKMKKRKERETTMVQTHTSPSLLISGWPSPPQPTLELLLCSNRGSNLSPGGEWTSPWKKRALPQPPPSSKKKKSIDQMYDVIWSNWQTQKL